MAHHLPKAGEMLDKSEKMAPEAKPQPRLVLPAISEIISPFNLVYLEYEEKSSDSACSSMEN